MNILVINASPRKNGNCNFLAEKVLERFEGSEVVNLRSIKMLSCNACKSCKSENELCIIDDDLKAIYQKILSADLLIFLSPNHMGFLSSLGKIFLDRWYCFRDANKNLRIASGKKAVFILIQGAASKEHGKNIIDWGTKFFTKYSFKTLPIHISGCSDENLDMVKMKLDETLTSISIFK